MVTTWDINFPEVAALFKRAKKDKSVVIMLYRQATERATTEYLQNHHEFFVN